MDNREYEKALDKCWNKFCESKPTLSKQAGVLTLFNFIFDYLYPIEKHNLTSDAEGEEMLTVPRKKVLYMYDFNEDFLICDPTHNGAKLLKAKLQELFGSKCLPGDTMDDTIEQNVASNVASSKPAEPDLNKESSTCTNDCSSQSPSQSRNLSQFIANCDKDFDTILKDGFREHNRLHIAAMAMQGILAAGEDYTGNCKFIAMKSLELADTLITEAEKGDTD